MKKFFALFIVIILCFALTACNGSYTKTDGTQGQAANGEVVEDITCEMTITRVETISGSSNSIGMYVHYLFTAKNDDYVTVFRGSASDYALLEVGDIIEVHYTLTSNPNYINGYKELKCFGETKTIEYFGQNKAS